MSQYEKEMSGPSPSGYYFSGLFWTSGLSSWASDLFHLYVVAHCLVSKKLVSSTGVANFFLVNSMCPTTANVENVLFRHQWKTSLLSFSSKPNIAQLQKSLFQFKWLHNFNKCKYKYIMGYYKVKHFFLESTFSALSKEV